MTVEQYHKATALLDKIGNVEYLIERFEKSWMDSDLWSRLHPDQKSAALQLLLTDLKEELTYLRSELAKI